MTTGGTFAPLPPGSAVHQHGGWTRDGDDVTFDAEIRGLPAHALVEVLLPFPTLEQRTIFLRTDEHGHVKVRHTYTIGVPFILVVEGNPSIAPPESPPETRVTPPSTLASLWSFFTGGDS